MQNRQNIFTAVDRDPLADRCPFFRPEANACGASVSGPRLEWRRRKNICTSDDHDRCTLFLGKILRGSRPRARLELWPMGQK